MPRVVHFEISVDEPARALKFYEDVFGWQTQKWDGPQPYWVVSTGDASQPGINGGIYKRDERMSFNTHVNTVDVCHRWTITCAYHENGARWWFHRFTLPGVGYLAYCQIRKATRSASFAERLGRLSLAERALSDTPLSPPLAAMMSAVSISRPRPFVG